MLLNNSDCLPLLFAIIKWQDRQLILYFHLGSVFAAVDKNNWRWQALWMKAK
jgi:hypothetical protein